MKQNKVQPIKVMDLNSVSVAQLIQWIEAGSKDAYFCMIMLKAAECRAREAAQARHYPSRVD